MDNRQSKQQSDLGYEMNKDIVEEADGIKVKNYVPLISNRAKKIAPTLNRVEMQGKPGMSMTCFSAKPKKETGEERTKSYVERFKTIGSQIVSHDQQELGKEKGYLNTLPETN